MRGMSQLCPLGDDCDWVLTYPPGYRDPPYDGTVKGFGEVVLPRRTEALLESMNGHLDSHGLTEFRFAWEAVSE